jgi:hypothetical protein
VIKDGKREIVPFAPPPTRLLIVVSAIPSRDSVIDIKTKAATKFKYEGKICETLKFMAEQYYFVCMCLCYQRWTHERERNIEWTVAWAEGELKTLFYVFIDFLCFLHARKEKKKFGQT